MATAARDADAPLVAELRELADQRHRDPAEVVGQVERLLAGVPPNDPARPTGHWVVGLTNHELGRLPEAVAAYRAAVARRRATARRPHRVAGPGQPRDLAPQPGRRGGRRARDRPGRRSRAPVGSRAGGSPRGARAPAHRRARRLPRGLRARPHPPAPRPRRRQRRSPAPQPRDAAARTRATSRPPSPTWRSRRAWPRRTSSGSWSRWRPTTSASPSVGGGTSPPPSRPSTGPRRPTRRRVTRPGSWRPSPRIAARCSSLSGLHATPSRRPSGPSSCSGTPMRRTTPRRGCSWPGPGSRRAISPPRGGSGGGGPGAAPAAARAVGGVGGLRGHAGRDPRHGRRSRAAGPRHAGPHPPDRPPPGGAGLAGRGAARPHLPGPRRARPRSARGGSPGARRRGGRSPATGPRCSASRRGTPAHCCAWRMTMRAAPSEPCVAGSRSSTSTGRPSVPPSCARDRRPTAPTSPASVFAWRWPRVGRRRCCDGSSAGGPAPSGCRRSPPPTMSTSRLRCRISAKRGPSSATPPSRATRRRRSRSASPGWRRWCADARCGRDRVLAPRAAPWIWRVCVIAWGRRASWS